MKIYAVAAAALCVVLMLGARGASAGDADIYANLGYGSLTASRITTGEITGRLGARFGDYFGVEGELNVGLGDHHFIFPPPCSGPVCPLYLFVALLNTKLDNAEAAYAVGFLPIAPNADLFARVGYGVSHYGNSGVIGRGFDPQGMNIGAGAQYFIDGSNGLRFDYTHSEFNHTNAFGSDALGSSANTWSIAYTRKF